MISTRGRFDWKGCLFIGFLCLTGILGAQTRRTQESDLQGEGKRESRNEYLEMRRKNPADPNFDAAKARFQAYQTMKIQESSYSGFGVSQWENIGPAPTTNGQTPTSNPRHPSDVTGRVSAIATDLIDGAVFIGGAQGGIWKTTDNGASWTPLTDHLGSLAVGSIATAREILSVGSAIVYLGTGEGNGTCDSYGGIGVYKSTDSGTTWSGPFGSAQFTNRSVVSIAVDRNDPDHVIAATASGIFGTACVLGPSLPSRGIFRSTDGGLTWSERTPGNNRASVILQDPNTDTTWWGAMWFTGNGGGPDGGLVRSTDNGVTWTQVAGTGGLPTASSAWSRAWVTATGSTIYVANGQTGGSIFKSTDGGNNWSQLTAATGFCNPQCFYDMPIYVDPVNADILYTGGAGLSSPGVVPSQFMRSDNGGTSFVDKVRSADMTTAQHADVHAITSFPGQPNHIWVGNDGGVWRSEDRGDNWINVNNNLAITQFTAGDQDPSDPDRAYGGTQDNGTMGWTGSDAWPHLDFGDGGFALIDQSTPDNLVHTYFNQTGGVMGVGWTTNGFATTMGFYTFSSAAGGNGINNADRVLFYAPIHLDRTQTDSLYFGTHRLYRANNFFATGTGFTALAGGQDLASPGGGALSAIETVDEGVEGANSQTIFTGSSTGEVYRSTNSGTTFTQVDVGGSPLYVSDIRVNPSDTNVVYQSRSGFATNPGEHIRKSVNGGSTWFFSGTGIPNVPVNAIEIDPMVAGRVWAGTDIGVYRSDDAGATWVPSSEGMATVAVFDLKANAGSGKLLAFTHGRSVYALELDPCFNNLAEAIQAMLDSLGAGEWPTQFNVLDYVAGLANICVN